MMKWFLFCDKYSLETSNWALELDTNAWNNKDWLMVILLTKIKWYVSKVQRLFIQHSKVIILSIQCSSMKQIQITFNWKRLVVLLM